MARAAFAQPVRGRRVAWTTSRPGFSMQFDLVGELRLIEEYLWDANAARVADLDDASLGRHVPTL